MNSSFRDILEQPMDRRQFLSRIGLVILAVLGISTILKVLSQGGNESGQTNTGGYGSSAYGQ